MDAVEDQDLSLHKSAPRSIADLKSLLPRFLTFNKVTRRLVRQTKTDQLIKLIDPFQESPQLLDPHLSELLAPLVDSFIEYLTQHASYYHKTSSENKSPDMIPLPRAICQILYVFCKVRGQKVIVNFFNNETKHLEPMLDAFEDWAHPKHIESGSPSPMLWQEKFVMLLWLSHLLLVPFDLDIMSSDSDGRMYGPALLSVDLPLNTPSIATCLLHTSLSYLGHPGKEKEAAAMLLMRLAVRTDKQTPGLQRSVVQSAVSFLDGSQEVDSTAISIHDLIGVLLFLLKFAKSAGSAVLKDYILPLHKVIRHIKSPNSRFNREITASTLAGKSITKLSRITAIASIKLSRSAEDKNLLLSDDTVDEIIRDFFAAFTDKDTSVRATASKSLSLVVLELNPQPHSGIAQVNRDTLCKQMEKCRRCSRDLLNAIVMETLKKYPLYEENEQRSIRLQQLSTSNPDIKECRKLHGLMLTLSYLLFRTAIPDEILSNVLNNILLGLQFQQRIAIGERGMLLGTDVRDAACFGLWALARRYKTHQLSQSKIVLLSPGSNATLQILANHLITAATLDPVGNIRRGASAAFQEMVGRHPNVIELGIDLVAMVNYHTVALRSSAIIHIAVDVAGLNELYRDVILDGLLGWRGVASTDPQIRRQAADALGGLSVALNGKCTPDSVFSAVRRNLGKALLPDDERHGLLLGLAHVVLELHEWSQDICSLPEQPMEHLSDVILDDRGSVPSMMSTNVLEGALRLIAAISVTSADTCLPLWFREGLRPPEDILSQYTNFINLALCQRDPLVVQAAGEAAANTFPLLDSQTRHHLAHKWMNRLREPDQPSDYHDVAVAGALGAAFPHVGEQEQLYSDDATHSPGRSLCDPDRETSVTQDEIIQTLEAQLSNERSIELRCAAVEGLASGPFKTKLILPDFVNIILKSLNDYTIDQRGDIGSLVRMEGINAAAVFLGNEYLKLVTKRLLIAKLGGLAVEKMDRVRWQAWVCLQPHLKSFGFREERLKPFSDLAHTSSVPYFEVLLCLLSFDWARKPFLEGFVTSAGAGSESLVQATREAFDYYMATLFQEDSRTICMTVLDMLMKNASNDRLLLPTMHFLVYLFDRQFVVFSPKDTEIWKSFFKHLQSAHRNTANIPKIEAAIRLYAAITTFEPLKNSALKKLCTLLTHRYSKIRNAAAESLHIITQEDMLLPVDWSKSPSELKISREQLESKLGLTTTRQDSSPVRS